MPGSTYSDIEVAWSSLRDCTALQEASIRSMPCTWRLLHTGIDHPRLSSEERPSTEEEIATGAGQSVPLHGLPEYLKAVHSAARKMARLPPDRGSRNMAGMHLPFKKNQLLDRRIKMSNSLTLARRRKTARHRHIQIAQGRRALHSRQGSYVDDIQASGHAVRAIVASLRHANIKSIDKAGPWPAGVVAVLVADT